MNADILLSAQDLSVRFGGVLAVNKVSFDVKRGEVFTLIGPNGAGKTTLFNLISGVTPVSAGRIEWRGVPITGMASHAVAGLGIARTFQNIRLFGHMTVLENVRLAVQSIAGGGHRHGFNLWNIWSDHGELLQRARAILDSDEYADTVQLFKNAGQSGTFFNKAHGYAVFPTVGKGALGIGGARGTGRVYVQGRHVADTTLTQLSIGFQAGGQTFSQIVFLEDERAFREFSSGQFGSGRG